MLDFKLLIRRLRINFARSDVLRILIGQSGTYAITCTYLLLFDQMIRRFMADSILISIAGRTHIFAKLAGRSAELKISVYKKVVYSSSVAVLEALYLVKFWTDTTVTENCA